MARKLVVTGDLNNPEYMVPLPTGEIPEDASVLNAAPLTTETVTILATQNRVIINPAGTIAAATIVFPTGSFDGQTLDITSTKAITTVTTSGATLVTALTAMTAGQKLRYIWSATLAKWC